MMTSYSVAVYSIRGCQLCLPCDLKAVLDGLSDMPALPLELDQLKEIKVSLPNKARGRFSRLLILVPDEWLAVSNSRTEDAIPSKLLPLAALSHAAEITFSSPESLWFSYQYEKVARHHFELTVFACSAELADALLEPFQEEYIPCVLMPLRQWKALKPKHKSWASLTKSGLSRYQ
ncbi:hypothetical protein OAH87_01135, partial [Marinomonas sp.]